MARIVYLDIDDEITSAAARIRESPEPRIAIVLPAGSRVATSRINFRLLAREAETRGRDLAIVAPEAGTRALAASAGIAAFATVGEYEAAVEEAEASHLEDPVGATGPGDPGPSGGSGGPGAPGGSTPAVPPGTGPGAAGGAAGVSDAGGAAGVSDASSGTGAGSGSSGRGGKKSATGRGGPPPAAAASAVLAAGAAGLGPAASGTSAGPPMTGVRARTGLTDTIAVRPFDSGVDQPRRRWPSALIVASLGVLIVVILVAGSAAWLLLPTATVTVNSRAELVGPLQFSVRADPLAVSVDDAGGIVPAQIATFDLAVSDQFPTTGKKVTETAASGTVRWTNCDPTRSYTIPAGTQARTKSAIAFKTADPVFLPVAILTGNPPRITCQSREVTATASKPGVEGNVPAGSITVVPSGYNSVVIRVSNPAAAAGGTHVEKPIVAEKDVDSAVTALTKSLRDQFTAQVDDPAYAPPGTTVYAATKSMSSPQPTVDPATLVGQAGETFELGMTGTGTATAVDPIPVEQFGETRIRAAVANDHLLVADSVNVTVGPGRVDGSAVVFPVTARAGQVAPLDAGAIRAAVKGMPVDEARVRLQDYGDATVETWPAWVTTITTVDFRLAVTVVSDVPTEPIGGPVASPRPSPSPSPRPTLPVVLPSRSAPASGPSGSGAGPSAPGPAAPSRSPVRSSAPSVSAPGASASPAGT